MLDRSTCKKNLLCDFTFIKVDDRFQVEKCVYCGKKVIYRLIDGRVDNKQYGRDHYRSILQPVGPSQRMFKRIYGVKAARKIQGAYKHVTWRTQEEKRQKIDDLIKSCAKDVDTVYL